MYLRPGSILDLTVIASGNNITEAAKFFDIPNSTFAAYIAGTRYIRSSAAYDIGNRWSKYVEQFLGDAFFSRKQSSNQEKEEKKIDLPEEEIWAWVFTFMFDVEHNLRQLVEPISWQKPFGCCAAQVLAQFEASQSDSSKLGIFTKEDAIDLLRLLFIGRLPTEKNLPTEKIYHETLNLAQRYILWRVKAREYYKLEQFYPISRCIEIRDTRPIPLLQLDEYPCLPPDHKIYHGDIRLPDTPRLKKAATLDVLMLCNSVEVRTDRCKKGETPQYCGTPQYYCSCISPSDDFIRFVANPIATPDRGY